MSHGRPDMSQATEVSLEPNEGWHCTHIYYTFCRSTLLDMDGEDVQAGRSELIDILNPDRDGSPERIQTSIVSGHKADFGLMLMDPDPLTIDRVHQDCMASLLGPALISTYSFVSLTEISEYVPSVEQYAERLVQEGEEQGSPAFEAKMKAYTQREPIMRIQRLTPEFPSWPATCFYPMNKKRKVGENWFSLDFPQRNKMMAEHARSGMAFAGKVTQLITTSVGFDDWEWGVTLWARNPEFLKDIVYRMRFDEASARFAEFGPFYTSYISKPEEMLDHCRVGV